MMSDSEKECVKDVVGVLVRECELIGIWQPSVSVWLVDSKTGQSAASELANISNSTGPFISLQHGYAIILGEVMVSNGYSRVFQILHSGHMCCTNYNTFPFRFFCKKHCANSQKRP